MRGWFGGQPVPGWPNFDGDTPDTPADTTWNWTQSVEFADATHDYRFEMKGPMVPGPGYSTFSGDWGKGGPRIGMQVLIQPRMSEAANGYPLKAV